MAALIQRRRLRQAQILLRQGVAEDLGTAAIVKLDPRRLPRQGHQIHARHRRHLGQPAFRLHPVVQVADRHRHLHHLFRPSRHGIGLPPLLFQRRHDRGHATRQISIHRLTGSGRNGHGIAALGPVGGVAGELDRIGSARVRFGPAHAEHRHQNVTGLIPLGDGRQTRLIALQRRRGADIGYIGKLAIGDDDRHHALRRREVLPGRPPGRPVLPQHRPLAGGLIDRQHQYGLAAGLDITRALGLEQGAYVGRAEAYGQGRQIAHGGTPFPLHLEVLDQPRHFDVAQGRSLGARFRAEPAIEGVERLALSLGDRPVARGGGIVGGHVDLDVADGVDIAGFLRLQRCGNSQQDDANGKPEQACQRTAVKHCKAFRFEYVRPLMPARDAVLDAALELGPARFIPQRT